LKHNGAICLINRTFLNLIPVLTKYTFFTPIGCFIDKTVLSEKMTLQELSENILIYNNVKAYCNARIFNYFYEEQPLLTCVLLYCKKCNYQNQLPFHFMQNYDTSLAAYLYSFQINQKMILEKPIDKESFSYIIKKDFSFDWLFYATPSSSKTLSTGEEFYFYDCPRCYWLYKSYSILGYTYRFAFTLVNKDNIKIG